MIRRIEALNYRNLRYVSQELRPFQVLVGPNASGKSTFLDVISLLADFVRSGLHEALLFGAQAESGRARRLDELVFNQATDRFELALEFIVPESLRHTNRYEDGKNETQHDLARYEVAFGKAESGELQICAETLWLIDSRRAALANEEAQRAGQLSMFPAEPSPPATILQSGKTPAGWQTVVKKVVAGGNDYFKAESSQWDIQFRVGPHKAALSSLPEDPQRFPVAIWVRNLLRDQVRVLALNGAAMRRPVSPSAPHKFSVDGSNLALVVQDLERDHPETFEEWVTHIRTFLPDLQHIHVHEREEDRHLYLALSYASNPEPVPAWLVSDGTLRLLALTLLAYLPDQASVYLIEEPENGIHPKAIEGVFQSFASVYRGQVLVATHSALFLGLAEPAQLLCFARTPSGAVDIVSGDKHPELRDWRGRVSLATLYAAGVLG